MPHGEYGIVVDAKVFTRENGDELSPGVNEAVRLSLIHILWEYEDKVWGAETNVFEAGRSQDIEGDYEEVISKEILSWPDMLPGT